MKFFIISMILLHGIQSYAGNDLKVYVPRDVLDEYNAISKNGEATLNYLIEKKARRDVMEIELFKAYVEPACSCKIRIVSDLTYKRALKSLEDGLIDSMANPIWQVDTKAYNFAPTTPVVKLGDFNVVFYTGSKEKAKINSKNDLLSKAIVTNPQWTVDYMTLKPKFKSLLTTSSWDSIVKMVSAGRADLTLAPYSSEKDHVIKLDKYILYPVKNFKIGLMNARVVVFNKKHEKLIEKVNLEIEKMTKNGTIRKAYQASGFFSKAIENWEEI